MTHQRTYQSDSEGLTDTTLLSDDHPQVVAYAGYDSNGQWQEEERMVGRWAHVLDTHTREMAAYDAPLRDWEETPDYSARSYSAHEREARFMRLSWWLERQRVRMVSLRRRGKNEEVERLRAVIAHCVQGIKQRYSDSVKLIVGREQNEWWMLYLKREQKDDLLVLARDAWRGR